MKKNLYNSLIAFFGGLFGVSILFIIYRLISNAGLFQNPFPPTLLGSFLYYLLFISFIEEGTKFLLIKRDIGQFPYGFLLGFGFGTGEAILKYPFWEGEVITISRSGAIVLHIITASIISYFVYKKKPVIGLLIAMILHTGFNLFLT